MNRRTITAIASVVLLAACNETVVEVLETTAVTINNSAPAPLTPGGTVTLSAQAMAGGTALSRTITWSSSNTAVATVNNGVVTAVGPGTATITASADGISAAAAITVNYPVPTVTSVSPTTLTASTATTITVTGTGFYSGTVVRVNGTAKPTTVVSSTQLTAALTAADVGASGTLAVTVFNPTPGGGASGGINVTVGDICTVFVPYTVGSTVNGSISTSDCLLNGFRTDLYSVTLTTGSTTFDMVSPNASAVDPFLELRDNSNNIVAFHDDITQTDKNARLRVIALGGAYRLFARPFNSAQTAGSYTLTSSTTSTASVVQCQENWLVGWPGTGMTVTESIAATDCTGGSATRGNFGDLYYIYLRAGQTVTIRENATFDTFLYLFDTAGVKLVEDDDSGGGAAGTNSLITFTAATAGRYLILASTYDPNITGAYTISVQ
jgi:hypothetical protein